MEHSKREMLVRIALLSALDDCEGFLLPEPTLLVQLRIETQPILLDSEFQDALRYCESQKYIIGLRPELGGPVKWKITDKGRAALKG